MIPQVTRRQALRGTVAAGVCGACDLLFPPVASAAEAVTRVWNTGNRGGLAPMQMKIYDIENEYGRQGILGSALYELHTALRDRAVYNNACTLRVNARGDTPVEFVDDAYWATCRAAQHPQFNTKRMLLWWQMFLLRDTASFPTINIRPFYERNDVWAYAPVGVVRTVYDAARPNGKDYTITGEFDVKVNLWHLGGGGVNDRADMWSSVIAHEMLHNLGHLHRPGEYVDGRQINAFHRAVYCRGGYDGTNHVPGFG